MSVEEIIFRALVPSDATSVATFFARCRDHAEMAFFHPFPLTQETAHQLACEPRLDRYYVADVAQAVVGLSMLRGWDEGYEVPSFGVMVDPRWHSRGVGSRLTDFTIAAASELGCESVRLSVYSGNMRATSMYVRRGFLEVSREQVVRDWGPDERIVMVKQL